MQLFRFGIDFSGTTAQRTITIGSDITISPSQTYNLDANCTTNGAIRLNVASTAYNYIFKTLDAGTNPTGTFVVFEVQGTVRSVSSVTQTPISAAVTPGSTVTITATLDGSLSPGQDVYLRYTTNNYTNSTVAKMTGSGTTYTANIPAGTNTAGANVSYYVFTSGPSNVATNGSNSDLYTINLNNNGGPNYSYTVLSPAAIYQHGFGTTTILTHPYTVAPSVFAANLSNSNWTNSSSAWTSFTGSTGEAIALGNSSGTPTITLTFDVASGFATDITSFNFWRQRSSTGAQNWSITINGISVGSGTVPTTGAPIGTTNVANAVNSLTGTVTVVLSLSGASGSGTFRLDDFTLNGYVYPLSGPTAVMQSPIGTVINNGGSRATFGNIIVGSSIDFTFRVRNVGGSNTLAVNSISFGGTHASDVSLVAPSTFPFSVSPGASQDLTVRVAPGELGARTATIIVASNDASGNASYVVNLSAAGVASAASDLVDNTTYSSADPDLNINIPYNLCTDGSATITGKSIAMKIQIRDGGGLNDADNLPTSLTAISFTVRNTSGTDRINFIKAAILTTSGGSVIGTGSIVGSEIVFSGLTDAAFTVLDGQSTSNLHLRVSFNEANVIDNEKLVYKVSSATAGSTGSLFAGADAGGAQTDNSTGNNQNRIEVVATAFAFAQPPTNTGFGQTMTPSPTVEARDANGRRDLDFAGAISLTSTGTMTGSPISVNAVAGLATYNSVIHTVQQTARTLTASGSLTSVVSSPFDINASSGTTDYFRTATGFTSGNWNATGSWESSPDNVTWVPSTVVPNSSASAITLRSGTLTITAAASAKLLTVQAGAVLAHNSGVSFTIADDGTSATDFLVQGRYELNGTQPTINSGASVTIASNAEVRATDNTGGGSDDFARNIAVSWQNNSLFNWDISLAFQASGETYFQGTAATVIPVFRSKATGTLGGLGITTFNGTFECNVNVTFQSATAIIFRNGITGTGSITQNSTCGQFRINGTTSSLGSSSGTLTLNLGNDVSSGLAVQAGTCTLQGNVTANTGPIYIDNGATLVAGTKAIDGSSSFTLNIGATLVTASPNGVNGSITVTGTKNFNSGANYTFNGAVNQTTGSLMGGTAGTLTIANTGSSGNQTTTLSNNNTTTTTLNLQSGLFAAGTNQTLQIANTGTINATSGDMVTTADGGNVWLLGNNTVIGPSTGKPGFYDLTIGSGIGSSPVTINSNPTVYHYCTLNNEASFSGIYAPTFATGSTLIYNMTGNYNRNVEWGNTPGGPGYPWHVIVQNGAILYLNTNPVGPTALEIGGDLTIGNGTTSGQVYMNNSMNKRLVVNGNLLLGGGTATGSVLGLSTVSSGDLELRGNYTRTANGTLTHNNRAVFLTGNANTTFNAPGTESLPYVIVDKESIDNQLQLSAPLTITEKLTLTEGRVITTDANILLVSKAAANAVEVANATFNQGYVDGPMRRVVSHASPGDYLFPVGSPISPIGGVGTYKYRPAWLRSDSGLATFNVRYDLTLAPTYAVAGVFLFGMLSAEQWQITQESGRLRGRVGLYYRNTNNPAHWVASPPPVANIAVAKMYSPPFISSNLWYLAGELDKNTVIVRSDNPIMARSWQDAEGFLWSDTIRTYSPFGIGWGSHIILPLRLLSFSATLTNGDGLLQWALADDKDLNYIEVQHSTDGQRFTRLANLRRGEAIRYLHRRLPAGAHYYRLLMVENSGKQSYSSTKVLQVGAPRTIITGLLQNPVQGTEALVGIYSTKAQSVDATVYDMSGRLLLRHKGTLAPGANTLRVPVLLLTQGLYRLQLRTADGVEAGWNVIR
jgi:hypothetical protein